MDFVDWHFGQYLVFAFIFVFRTDDHRQVAHHATMGYEPVSVCSSISVLNL